MLPWWKRWRKPAYKYDDSLRDFTVLKALESDSDSLVWQHFPRCVGWIETNLGTALVTDLIRDADGNVSRTLRNYLQSSFDPAAVQQALDDFIAFFERKAIPVRSLFTDNIAAQVLSDGSLRLVVIDGLGSTIFIPWYKWNKRLGRFWAKRKTAHLRLEVAMLIAKNNHE